jgi:hypothetical protein
MSEQRWPDHWHDDHHAALEVRHVHPYEAVKAYRCPGCDHEIPPGLGHEVVVPLASPVDRRHWHTGCWRRAARRR